MSNCVGIRIITPSDIHLKHRAKEVGLLKQLQYEEPGSNSQNMGCFIPQDVECSDLSCTAPGM